MTNTTQHGNQTFNPFKPAFFMKGGDAPAHQVSGFPGNRASLKFIFLVSGEGK
ncbi:MAG: hypothetical protein AB1453_00420 [Chloroflexota bacterium]